MEIDPSSKTIVAQQFKAYQRKNICCHPRIRLLHDLRVFILNQQLQGNKIVLGIDANLDQPTDPIFLQFLSSCNLIDVLHQQHGQPTSTHCAGNKLDIIAGT